MAFLRISIGMARDKENQKRIAREWYQRNKELTMERSHQWAENNPERRKAIKAKYKKANRGKENFHLSKRRAAKLLRTPKWLTADDLFIIEEAYHLAKLRSNLTGIQYHVDHILPLQGKKVSGLHVPNNLQVIPAKLNLQKSNKHE